MFQLKSWKKTTLKVKTLWDYENQLKKGDNIVLSAFGGGFTWGAVYLKWAYNS